MPVLIEAMTYRGGHHSTSDDASRCAPTRCPPACVTVCVCVCVCVWRLRGALISMVLCDQDLSKSSDRTLVSDATCSVRCLLHSPMLGLLRATRVRAASVTRGWTAEACWGSKAYHAWLHDRL